MDQWNEIYKTVINWKNNRWYIQKELIAKKSKEKTKSSEKRRFVDKVQNLQNIALLKNLSVNEIKNILIQAIKSKVKNMTSLPNFKNLEWYINQGRWDLVWDFLWNIVSKRVPWLSAFDIWVDALDKMILKGKSKKWVEKRKNYFGQLIYTSKPLTISLKKNGWDNFESLHSYAKIISPQLQWNKNKIVGNLTEILTNSHDSIVSKIIKSKLTSWTISVKIYKFSRKYKKEHHKKYSYTIMIADTWAGYNAATTNEKKNDIRYLWWRWKWQNSVKHDPITKWYRMIRTKNGALTKWQI